MSEEQRRTSKKDDRMRAILVVYTTLQSFVLILFFGVAPFMNFKMRSEESLGIVELVLPLFTGYIGLMVGYYYGAKEHQQ